MKRYSIEQTGSSGCDCMAVTESVTGSWVTVEDVIRLEKKLKSAREMLQYLNSQGGLGIEVHQKISNVLKFEIE